MYNFFTLPGIIIYCDLYMEDNKIMISNDSSYIIVNPKTALSIKNTFLKKERKNKLLNIRSLDNNIS